MLPIHKKQRDAFKDPARFKFILAGRRGGKTVGMREDLLSALPGAPDKGEIFYIGPTNQTAKDLIWDDLIDRLDDLGWQYKPRVAESCFRLSRGRKIFIIGAEKIRRIRGHKVFRAYLDEIAFYSEDLNKIWRAVRPALSDLRGKAVIGTTPDGKGTQAYDFYLKVLEKQAKGKSWKYFTWNTIDNPFIDPAEIEEAKQELDERSFQQEYMASWQSFEGLAYYNFQEDVHIKSCSEFIKGHPIAMMLDFNVNPTSLLLGQDLGYKHSIKKEYSLKNSSTINTVKTFCEDFKDQARSTLFEIYGDATGQSRRSNTGFSDYHYIQEIMTQYGFNYQMKVLGDNPAIIDRVAHVNAHLRNAKGEVRIEIDPSCTDTIRDLSGQVLEGRFPSDKNNMGHKADALGYYIYCKTMLSKRRSQQTIQL